jgi:hypothetical protein
VGGWISAGTTNTNGCLSGAMRQVLLKDPPISIHSKNILENIFYSFIFRKSCICQKRYHNSIVQLFIVLALTSFFVMSVRFEKERKSFYFSTVFLVRYACK